LYIEVNDVESSTQVI